LREGSQRPSHAYGVILLVLFLPPRKVHGKTKKKNRFLTVEDTRVCPYGFGAGVKSFNFDNKEDVGFRFAQPNLQICASQRPVCSVPVRAY